MGEIECAIGIEQLKKLSKFVKSRQKIAKLLNNGLKDLEGLEIPKVNRDSTHAYYVYPMILDIKKIGISRNKIIEALTAEGIEGLMGGYANIHLLPMYQRKIAYGSNGFPWSSEICKRDVSYKKGICPVAEELHENSLGYEMCLHDLSNQDTNLIIEAFYKVWSNLDEIR